MILVVGATGVVGGEICRRLRARNEPVRALVRPTSDAAKVEALRAAGCELVRGDLKDRASLDAACAGARAVVSSATMIASAQPGDSFEATDEQGTLQLVDAACAAKAEHFVYVSVPTENMTENPLRTAKAAVQDALRRCGIAYTILQPSYFMESWLGPMLGVDVAKGTAQLFGDGNQRISYISARDVAEFAVQALLNPAARNQTIRLGGPRTLTPREAIGLFERELGRPLNVIHIPEAALAAQAASAQDPMQKAFAGLMLSATRADEVPMDDVLARFPVQLTPVEEYVRERVKAGA